MICGLDQIAPQPARRCRLCTYPTASSKHCDGIGNHPKFHPQSLIPLGGSKLPFKNKTPNGSKSSCCRTNHKYCAQSLGPIDHPTKSQLLIPSGGPNCQRRAKWTTPCENESIAKPQATQNDTKLTLIKLSPRFNGHNHRVPNVDHGPRDPGSNCHASRKA